MAEEEKGEIYYEEEPWLPIESKLVIQSLVVGIVAMIILAVLVNKYILP